MTDNEAVPTELSSDDGESVAAVVVSSNDRVSSEASITDTGVGALCIRTSVRETVTLHYDVRLEERRQFIMAHNYGPSNPETE